MRYLSYFIIAVSLTALWHLIHYIADLPREQFTNRRLP
jgi:hypothetical protein